MQKFILPKSQALDNVQFFKENSENDYCKMVQKIIMEKPFGNNKFYLYQFVKRVDDTSGIKKMYHQPRLTKPDPVPGTTLLRCDPNDPGTVTIIWTLPNEETFNLYSEGKMFSDGFVYECIQKFLKNPRSLMQPEEGDLSPEAIREFYVAQKHKKRSKVRESA